MDGFAFAQAVFGASVSKLAPFQSLETTLGDRPCSLLRLCENNFRLAIAPEVAVEVETHALHTGRRMWLKPSTFMAAIALHPPTGIPYLSKIAVTKPIYSLTELAPNCAVPARIEDVAVLIWQHSPLNVPVVDLHVAVSQISQLRNYLRQASIEIN